MIGETIQEKKNNKQMERQSVRGGGERELCVNSAKEVMLSV